MSTVAFFAAAPLTKAAVSEHNQQSASLVIFSILSIDYVLWQGRDFTVQGLLVLLVLFFLFLVLLLLLLLLLLFLQRSGWCCGRPR